MTPEPTPQNPQHTLAPPGKEYITLADTPEAFLQELPPHPRVQPILRRALSRIREEKADTFTPLGTGVLVTKSNRFGILTAHHCLHACSPQVRLGTAGGDRLSLILCNARGITLEPQEVQEHVLATPQTEEFGPDLTFIEVLAPQQVSSGLRPSAPSGLLDRPPHEVTRDVW